MPQLAPRGKWVFGWAIVQDDGTIHIPPEAWTEYGFASGDQAILIQGSRTSGGFGLATAATLGLDSPIATRAIGHGPLGDERIQLPAELGLLAGTRLLVVRGSGRALSFLTRGPIYELALTHPELTTV